MVNVYTTALAFERPRPSWVTDTFDQDRVTAYQTMWDIYHNIAEAFDVVLRDDSGEEISRRFVPSGRTIVEATNNYLAKNLKWTRVPLSGADSDFLNVDAAMKSLFDREKFLAKFASLKRWMLVRGDALLHVTGDSLKEAGRRIRISEISPETYFPIYNPIDPEQVIGCYLVQPMVDADGKAFVSRLFYRRILSEEDSSSYAGSPIGSVFVQLAFFKADKWDDREEGAEIEEVPAPDDYNVPSMELTLQGTTLPAEIKALPVYHFRNNYSGSEPFGVSELQGLETLITGMNQTMTDEELALVLQGIGVYYTDSGSPLDDEGNPTEWIIAPAAVLELEAGKTFGRVQGVTSVQPFQDHQGAMHSGMMEASGTPGVAVGQVDVQAAQSGIALEIQFRPLLSKNGEKEEELKGVLRHLLFDLVTGFLPGYEQISPGPDDNPVKYDVSFDSPLPIDRVAVMKEIMDMVTAKIIDGETARAMITERLGISFPAGVGAAVAAEQAQALDLVGARLDAAASGSDGTGAGAVSDGTAEQ